MEAHDSLTPLGNSWFKDKADLYRHFCQWIAIHKCPVIRAPPHETLLWAHNQIAFLKTRNSPQSPCCEEGLWEWWEVMWRQLQGIITDFINKYKCPSRAIPFPLEAQDMGVLLTPHLNPKVHFPQHNQLGGVAKLSTYSYCVKGLIAGWSACSLC